MRVGSFLVNISIACAALPAVLGAQAVVSGTVFDSLVPRGRYTVRFQHPVLDSVLVSAEPVTFTVGDSSPVSLSLASPSIRAFVRTVCPRASEATGLVVGRVRDASDSAGIVGAVVSTGWTEVEFAKSGMVRANREVIAHTNKAGSYVLCGVPADIGTEVVAVTDSAASAPAELFLKDVLVARRDFLLSRHAGATARVTGTVLATRGGPAVGAQVAVAGKVTTRTDAAGRFSINNAPAGTQTVEARLLGSRPVSQAVNLFEGQSTEVSLSFRESAVALPTVSVLGKGNGQGRFSGFGERLRQGQGHYLTPADVAKYQAYDLRQLLFRAGGLATSKSGTSSFFTMRATGGNRCIPEYFVDGVVWSGAANTVEELNHAYRAENIRAVEVYAGLGTVPAEYDMKRGCGVVLIWTK